MDSLRPRIPEEKQLPPLERPFLPTPARNLPKEVLYVKEDDFAENFSAKKKKGSKKSIRKILLIISGAAVLAVLCWMGFFAWKTYAVSKKISSGSSVQTTWTQDFKSLVSPFSQKSFLSGQEAGRINILLMGAAGEKNPGGNLTDTVMVMSLDTKNNKISLLSLPRDLYVNIPDTKTYAKINSLYKIGLNKNIGTDLIKQAVEQITGLTINYYMAVDFDAFKKIIDDISGINVMVARDILDQRYPGPNYSYETFSLSKGFHALDGATALKYVRERHDDPQGDFGRALRQQQVIQAVKSKLFSTQTLFNVVALNNILDTLGDNVKTDMQFSDIENFIALSKKMDTQNITNVVADAWKSDSLLKVSHVQMGNASAFVLLPRVGNYSEIQDLAQNIFNQNEIKKRNQSIADEKASIAIINRSGNSQLAGKIQSLLRDKLGMKNVRIVSENSASTISQTTVVDNSGGAKIFTLDELIKKIPSTLSKDINTSSSDDITLTLGQDIASTYMVEDATIEQYNQAQDQENNF